MVMKIGGYYYRYEDEYAVLASPQEAKPSIPEDAKPRDVDISVMIEEIQADTTLRITGIRNAWTGLRTEASDGVPVVGFDKRQGYFWLAGQSGYGFQTALGFAKLAADLLIYAKAGDWVSQQAVTDLKPSRLR
ncbi:MAG: FAD-binding oxidoreductase [Micrococcus sp.]|nr:FAD-binding oxidoreductase [Micrococcus sp.]